MIKFMSKGRNQSEFYYIEVKSKTEYKTFRVYDVDENGGIERVDGQREDGTWETVKWLVNKKRAHVENGKLIADHPRAKELFEKLETEPIQIEGKLFKAMRNIASQN
jgi:hypothetical protein